MIQSVSVDQVISNYMKVQIESIPQRENFLASYYGNQERSKDPCWTKIESKEYGVLDYCDIFRNASKEGTVLALYSAAKSISDNDLNIPCKYPMQGMKNNIFNYFGLKLNILAYLSPFHVSKLILYYGDNKHQTFFQREIIATTVLDHFREHYKPKAKAEQKEPEQPKISNLNLFS